MIILNGWLTFIVLLVMCVVYLFMRFFMHFTIAILMIFISIESFKIRIVLL